MINFLIQINRKILNILNLGGTKNSDTNSKILLLNRSKLNDNSDVYFSNLVKYTSKYYLKIY